MKKRGKGIDWRVLILCAIIVLIVALLGSMFTSSSSSSEWYIQSKPSIAPSGAVIGAVWTILFILIAISLYFSLISGKKSKKIMILFGINFILNILWSVLFFGLKNPALAFADLILLWLSILYLVIFNWKVSRVSSYLLIPYLLWVAFAGYLNLLFFI